MKTAIPGEDRRRLPRPAAPRKRWWERWDDALLHAFEAWQRSTKLRLIWGLSMLGFVGVALWSVHARLPLVEGSQAQRRALYHLQHELELLRLQSAKLHVDDLEAEWDRWMTQRATDPVALVQWWDRFVQEWREHGWRLSWRWMNVIPLEGAEGAVDVLRIALQLQAAEKQPISFAELMQQITRLLRADWRVELARLALTADERGLAQAEAELWIWLRPDPFWDDWKQSQAAQGEAP